MHVRAFNLPIRFQKLIEISWSRLLGNCKRIFIFVFYKKKTFYWNCLKWNQASKNKKRRTEEGMILNWLKTILISIEINGIYCCIVVIQTKLITLTHDIHPIDHCKRIIRYGYEDDYNLCKLNEQRDREKKKIVVGWFIHIQLTTHQQETWRSRKWHFE